MPALVDRIAAGAATEDIIARAHGLASAVLDADELVDLELIATGAASPLTGFAGRADYHAILATGQLADGTPWPVPFTLAVADVAVRPREALALRDHAGRLWGVLNVTDVFARDTERELAALYGTRDPAHPGVASMLARPTTLVGGMVDVLPLPADRPAARDRLTPRELRAVIAERGWRSVAGDSARDPLRRADEQVTKIGLELCDGLVLLVRLDPAQPPAVQLHALRALVAAYYPADRVVVALRPGARRHAGAAEARLDALIDANYGITFALTALAPAFYCAGCGAVASRASCPHEVSRRIGLSDDRVRALLVAGDAVPPEVMRPEVAEILRAHHQATVRVSGTPPASAASAARAAGFILWFTGMSGAGKSTLARAVAAQLGGERALEILDGDEVRTHLSAGLGFSREDRDTNVHRIGFVARTLAGHGVGVVTAAISPYRDTRAAVRAAAEAKGIPFVEVFANAPLEALVGRDVKGLYKQALAGELAHFTGVSDPYEPPTAPDIEVHTDRESVADSVATIIAALRTRGVLAPCATEVASP